MAILMIHPHDLFSPMEPWTIRIMKFAEELSAKGHEVTLAYFPLEERKREVRGIITYLPLDRTISPGSLWRNTRNLCRVARTADVVHVQKSHFYATLPALLAACWTGRPLHYDWDDWEEKIFYGSLHKTTLIALLTGLSFRLLERTLPFLADRMSVSSEKLRRLAINRGADPRNVFLVPVGADLGVFRASLDAPQARQKHAMNGELLVLYHGQLHSCQYVKLFLRSAKILKDKKQDKGLKFMVLGDGSELGRLKKFALDLGLEDQVVFTGFVPHAEVAQYIAAADICVAPFEDNQVTRCKSPLKIAEYLACGKPIIASNVGDVRHMIDGAGLLVPPGKPEEIANAVLTLAEDEPQRKAMALAARQRAEAIYNWRCSAATLAKAYETVGLS